MKHNNKWKCICERLKETVVMATVMVCFQAKLSEYVTLGTENSREITHSGQQFNICDCCSEY
jgi:hypothetical protein